LLLLGATARAASGLWPGPTLQQAQTVDLQGQQVAALEERWQVASLEPDPLPRPERLARMSRVSEALQQADATLAQGEGEIDDRLLAAQAEMSDLARAAAAIEEARQAAARGDLASARRALAWAMESTREAARAMMVAP
jgi:hypothetical protein